jgi:hypothetical protein
LRTDKVTEHPPRHRTGHALDQGLVVDEHAVVGRIVTDEQGFALDGRLRRRVGGVVRGLLFE